MKFYIYRGRNSLYISKIIKVYKGALKIENSLGENIFNYEESWDILTGEDRDIITVEFILSRFPGWWNKKLTEKLILDPIYRYRSFRKLEGAFDSVKETLYTKEYNIFINYRYLDKKDILQEIDIPVEKIIIDKSELTKNNYIIQLSLLELNN